MHNFRMLDTVVLTPATANCLADWCGSHVPQHLTLKHLRILLARCAAEAQVTADAEERDMAYELIEDLAPLANFDCVEESGMPRKFSAEPPIEARGRLGVEAASINEMPRSR